MKIKKNLLYGILIIAVLVIAGFFLFHTGNAETGTVKVASKGDVQIVKMHVEGGSYVFEPSSVKAGQPVRIEADMTRMPGCSKSVISSELGIRKTFTDSSNTLEFTPTKAGTFYISCSMNMYRGSLIVLGSDGSKSAYVQVPNTTGASCGSSGGCGCGG